MVLGLLHNLNQAETGCLLLADITGYTSYLQATELTMPRTFSTTCSGR